LRRNPDMKWRQAPEDVAELTKKQSAILAAAARLLKPGGRLVYATCSILEDENRKIAEDFLARHPQFGLLHAGELLKRERIALEMGDYLELWPHRHGTDGFFAAAFERSA
jgi:16S rRNA (cytosine967-C5)-methyltransferase